MQKTCEECKAVFEVDTSKRNWQAVRLCSPACQKARDAKKKRQKYVPQQWPQKRTCEWCKSPFLVHKPGGRPAKFCGKACANAKKSAESALIAEGKRTSRVCPSCGKAFLPTKYNHGKQTFCSQPCYWEARRLKSFNAQNRYSSQTEFARSRRFVMKRDGNKCVLCGRNGKVHVHHKDNSGGSETPNHSPENLITLCTDCHNAFHGIAIVPRDDGWAVTGKIFEILGIKGTVRVV